ncbi:hypothetical protein RF55_19691 [Lasius niger]|uniref:Uncharacterized protein n=1 Tax=Lasius niger TaxID=67767 RepID=A0A0J7K077_LASNI|nr:hypothetical protein RF55_19691 [Lasius niger]
MNSQSEDSDNDVGPSPSKKAHLSREQELEEMLDGLKTRFSSLSVNDPLRITILTIAPDCWSIRKTASEFGTSRRSVRKSRNLKKSEGILPVPVLKAGKILPKGTMEQILGFYEDDEKCQIKKIQSLSKLVIRKKKSKNAYYFATLKIYMFDSKDNIPNHQ